MMGVGFMKADGEEVEEACGCDVYSMYCSICFSSHVDEASHYILNQSKPIENMKGIDGRHQISSARRSKDLVNKYPRIRKGADAGEDVKNSSLRST
ncbi:hypothetical protein L2E82_51893 [Cichorium intybus]|nr:hypothetical protein L2E82_51893 [Cichorium intybus]